MIDNNKFEAKANELDKMIREKVAKWTGLLPNPINGMPLFQNFQEHLMYVIMSFLNQENTSDSPQELFIQIPVEEFANLKGGKDGDKVQIDSFRRTTGTIAACLLMSCTNKIWDTIKVSEVLLNSNKPWYKKLDTSFLAEFDESTYRILTYKEWPSKRQSGLSKYDMIYTTIGKKYSQRYLGYIDENKKTKKITNRELCNIRSFYNLKECARYNLQEVLQELEKLRTLQNICDTVLQYDSAALVHIGKYEPINENIPIESRYFETLDCYNCIENLQNALGETDTKDVIIVIGDKRYIEKRQAFRDCAAKKIIYIGSEEPAPNLSTYPFTFREFYRYCAPKENLRFEEPTMLKNIDFPWLDETMKSLDERLKEISKTDEFLTDDVKTSIKYFFRSRFTDIDFCKEKWESQKYEIDLSSVISFESPQETIDSIHEWCENLEYNGVASPKCLEMAKLQLKPALVYGKDWKKQLILDKRTKGLVIHKTLKTSYKKDIPNLTNEGNLIVLDCASYNKGDNDAPKYKAYQYTLSHHLFSHIVALYYKCEENYIKGIQWFLNQEFKCYESMMRKQLDTSIPVEEVKDSPYEDVNETIFSLEDFMDANDIFGRWTEAESRKAIVTFKNGEEKRIDGDVLVVDGEKFVRKSIFSLADINFDNKDITIIYYQNPKNFDELMTAYFNFPVGADIPHYEKIWKTALQNFVNKDEKKHVLEIVKSTKISKEKIKRYTKENCPNKFLGSRKEMNEICKFLTAKGYLQESEISWIMAAKKAYDQYKPMGGELKEEVLNYKEGELPKSGFISKVSQKLGITAETIAEKCSNSNIIMNIDID